MFPPFLFLCDGVLFLLWNLFRCFDGPADNECYCVKNECSYEDESVFVARRLKNNLSQVVAGNAGNRPS